MISHSYRSFDLSGKLSFELMWSGDMKNLKNIHEETEVCRKEVEFYKKLVDHWEGRWKQEWVTEQEHEKARKLREETREIAK